MWRVRHAGRGRVVVESEGRKNATAMQFVLLFSRRCTKKERGGESKERSVSRCVDVSDGQRGSKLVVGCIAAPKDEMQKESPLPPSLPRPSVQLYCSRSPIVLDEMHRRLPHSH